MDDFPLPEPPSKDRNLLAIELVSGSVGGAAQVISGQVSPILDLRSNTDPKPLDTLKTRAQTAPRGQFKNTLDIFKTTVRNEGILALYKGASEVDRSVY
jgi:solute carrier family 25 carnitine/acylcarnitine transporter 20/29